MLGEIIGLLDIYERSCPYVITFWGKIHPRSLDDFARGHAFHEPEMSQVRDLQTRRRCAAARPVGAPSRRWWRRRSPPIVLAISRDCLEG
jgi:hypothetical protein